MPGPHRFLGFYLLIGLLQGIVLSLFDKLYTLGQPLVFVILTLALLGGMTLQLLGEKARRWRSLLPALVFTLLMGALTLWISYRGEPGGGGGVNVVAWLFSLLPLSYIGASFLSAWPATKGQRWRYEDLFHHAWSNVFIVLGALILVGLYLLLATLWSQLFLMLGIEFFNNRFWSNGFMSISLPLVFALGMFMGVCSERVIGQVRSLFFGVCRLLLPMIALISLLFTLALPFTGLEQIWATGYSTPILLVLVGAQLFLLNGVFQAGGQHRPFPEWLMRIIGLSLLCLPILAALAFYSSWLRVEQYALSPQRFIALALAVLCGMYSVAAVWAVVLRSAVWLSHLRVTNPVLALLCCALLVLINTPLLDPQRLSANDQVRRVLDGRTPPEAFDARNLRFGLGKAGEEAFAKLQIDLDQGRILNPQLQRALRARMDDTALSESERYAKQWAWHFNPDLEWIGPLPKGSDQFVDIIRSTETPCTTACVLWAVDLDQDGQDEVLMVPRNSPREAFKPPRIYVLDEKGDWDSRGPLLWTRLPDGYVETETLIRDIRAGNISLVKPRYRQLQSSDMLLTPVIREP